jgi:hypothetical protein
MAHTENAILLLLLRECVYGAVACYLFAYLAAVA